MEYNENKHNEKDREKFMKHAQILGLVFIPLMIYALVNNLQNELTAMICIIFIVLNTIIVLKPKILYKILS